MSEINTHHLRLLEAVLFASTEVLPERLLARALPEEADLPELLKELQAQYADKIVFLSWQDDVDIDMSVSMTIEVLNKSGLLADVSSALGALKVNIHSIYAKEVNQEYGKLVLTVTLHSQQHLERLSKRLLSVDGVEKVYRSLEKF